MSSNCLKKLLCLAAIVFVASGLALGSNALAAAPQQTSQEFVSVNNVDALARSFAGMNIGKVSGDVIIGQGPNYRGMVSASWNSYQQKLGVPMSRWASKEVAFPGGGTVFYPFSGPDFATVGQLFPGAERYVLVAIQAARQPPDPTKMNPVNRQAMYGHFATEWKSFGRLGFFRTNDLEADVRNQASGVGVSPILMAFAARLGYRVLELAPIAYNEAKKDYDWAELPENTPWQSVRLVLSRDGRMSFLDYVQMDLSDTFLGSHDAERQWLERMAKNPVLLKAASHLPQRPQFTVIRDAILANAPLVVQDETGIEYKDLVNIGDIALYGRFVKPYKLFDRGSQQSLAVAYKSAKQAGSLPFSFSYLKAADQRSVQIARRKPVNVTGEPKPDGKKG